jgi:quinohemoprotein ethanol dehydrogenase
MRFFPRSLNMGYSGGMEVPDNYLLIQSLLKAMQKGYLKAWDPVTQTEKWRVEYPCLGNGGVLATAGNLVFQGEIRGNFHAYAADSGTPLWEVSLPNSIVAAPITYRADGEQYVAILTGSGGGTLLAGGIQMNRSRETGKMLAFKLGGKVQLPPPPSEDPIPDPPQRIELTSEERSSAKALYMDHCLRCHGLNGVSNGQVPDLRRLAPVWHENFDAVVRLGMMEDAGMPSFGDVLGKRQVETIHAWLIELAWHDKELRAAPQWLVDLKVWFYDKLAAVIVWWMHRGLDADTPAQKV